VYNTHIHISHAKIIIEYNEKWDEREEEAGRRELM